MLITQRNLLTAMACAVAFLALLVLRPGGADPSAAGAPAAANPTEQAVSPWLSPLPGADPLQAQGQPWQASTDAFQGGASTATLHVVEAEAGSYLRVQGEVAAGVAYPWSGALWMLGEAPMAAVDVRDRQRLQLRLRGDGRALMVMLLSGESESLPQMRWLDTGTGWESHTLALDEFAGADLSRLRAVVVAASLPQGSFRFDLAELSLQ